MSESKTSHRRLSAVDRQRQALELRAAGKSFPAIAAELGYAGSSSAYRAVQSAIMRTLQEPADEVRKLELERLDRMLDALWEQAIAGKWLVIDRVLAIMERRAKLLGLDAPAKVDVTHRVRELAEAEGLDPDEAVAAAQRILRSHG